MHLKEPNFKLKKVLNVEPISEEEKNYWTKNYFGWKN